MSLMSRSFESEEDTVMREIARHESTMDPGRVQFLSSVAPSSSSPVRETRKHSSSRSKKEPSCCFRFRQEVNPCQDWFTVTDVGSGRKIHVQRSFAPDTWFAFGFKLLAASLVTIAFTISWVESTDTDFYLAYLSSWSMLVTVAALWTSWINTILASKTAQPPETVGFRIRLAWTLFTIALHSEIVVTILYWAYVYDAQVETVDFLDIVLHGGAVPLLFLDGLLVNRVPLRWPHWWGVVLPYDLLYLLWTVLHAVLNVGNPNTTSPDEDDALYSVVNWNEDWTGSLAYSLVLIFVVGPVLFALLWFLSVYSICGNDRRFYIDNAHSSSDAKSRASEFEERSIFSMWGRNHP